MALNSSNKSIGLDLSLTKTGVVILQKGKIIYRGLIKSKPVGDKPKDELQRIVDISLAVAVLIDQYSPSVAIIENLAFMAKGTSLTQLAGLSYLVRSKLAQKNIPFFLVAPTSLKKFVTGSGKGEKDAMMAFTLQRYGIMIPENNECDAFALAKIGEILLKPDKSIPSFQKEVIELLKKQNG